MTSLKVLLSCRNEKVVFFQTPIFTLLYFLFLNYVLAWSLVQVRMQLINWKFQSLYLISFNCTPYLISSTVYFMSFITHHVSAHQVVMLRSCVCMHISCLWCRSSLHPIINNDAKQKGLGLCLYLVSCCVLQQRRTVVDISFCTAN